MTNKIATFIWQNSVTILIIIAAFAVLKACEPAPRPAFSVNPKVIERRIEGKTQEIHHHTKQVNNFKDLSLSMNQLRDQMLAELEEVKRRRDTTRIIQVQDSTISVLLTHLNVKDSIIYHQDAIISSQGYVIASKDTLLLLSKDELRKVKRQRNWSFVANGALVGLLILK